MSRISSSKPSRASAVARHLPPPRKQSETRRASHSPSHHALDLNPKRSQRSKTRRLPKLARLARPKEA